MEVRTLTIMDIANPIVMTIKDTIIAEHLKATNKGHTLTVQDVNQVSFS